MTLRDILAQLARPGRDPREDLPPPVFKQGIIKLEDLTPGMELTGTVLNVVDFGCFVDIGMHDSGLVHVSRMADRFIRDPHEVVAVGDIVHVWVMEVDKERRRVSLTMVRPGSRTPADRPDTRVRGEGGAADQARAGRSAPASRRRRRKAAVGTGRRAAGQADKAAGRRTSRRRSNRSSRANSIRADARKAEGRRAGGPTKAVARHPRGGQQAGGPGGYVGPPVIAAARGAPRPGSPPSLARFSPARPVARHARREFKPKPQPLAPITDAMKKGKEPMRTFGDLMQFFENKDETRSRRTEQGAGSGER